MKRVASFVAVFFFLSFHLLTFAQSTPAGQAAPRIVQQGLPVIFEPAPSHAGVPDISISGVSVSDIPIFMIGRLPGVTVGFGPAMIDMQVRGQSAGRLQVVFAGAARGNPQGANLQASYSNYLLGEDRSHWRTHVPNYSRVAYRQLYPGIDAVFYGNGQELEHDFVVAPGADYRQIRMHLAHLNHLTGAAHASVPPASILPNGDLAIAISGGELRMHRPEVYQESSSGRQPRSGSFQLLPGGDVGFSVGAYDRSRTLIIDPVLTFSTFLSSQVNTGSVYVATDSSGSSYLTGATQLGFPVTSGAFAGCGACSSTQTVTYISKLNATGSALTYSTLIGGSGATQPAGIAVDANGNALVAGTTQGAGFPTKNAQPTVSGSTAGTSGFLVSLSADGSSLNYGTLLAAQAGAGETSNTTATAIALDIAGDAYVAGATGGGTFPVTAGALDSEGSASAQSVLYLAKFSPAGALISSALLGEADPQNGGFGPFGVSAIAVDAAGDAFLAGEAGGLWPTTGNAYLQQIPGVEPYVGAFVTAVAANSASLLYSTFLPASYAAGIGVLANGNVFVAGSEPGTGYPVTAGGYQSNLSFSNGFLAELNSTGSSLVYSTLFGDSTYSPTAMALDPDGDIWLTGTTESPQFPLAAPLQSTFNSPESADASISVPTLTQFDPTGTILKFSTYLPDADGFTNGLAIDPNHRAHLAGTVVYILYTTPGAYLTQVPVNGLLDTYSFAAVIDSSVPAPSLCVSPNIDLSWGAAEGAADRPVTITSCGALPLTISSVSSPGSAFTVPADENTCPETLPVGVSCTLDVHFAPTVTEPFTGQGIFSTLVFESNAPLPQTVLGLYADITPPKIQVSTVPGFNPTVVGQTSQGYLIPRNEGIEQLNINFGNTTITGDFSLRGQGTCLQPIFAGDFCILYVYFTPTAPGSSSGVLQLASDDPLNPITSISLSGTGLAPPGPTAEPGVSLSPSSLTFAAQVGTASDPQSISLSDSGTASLTGITITIAGTNASEFRQTNNCTPSVSASQSCIVSVSFIPASAAVASAILSISDNASGSPQSVPLMGTGTPPLANFSLSAPAGGSSSGTVTAGQPATYALSATAASGYSGTLSLSCSGLPANAACSFNPASITLSGGNSASFTVTVATTASQTSSLSRLFGAGYTLAGLLVLLPFSWRKYHRRWGRFLALGLVLLTAGIGLSGCGGSGSTSGSSTGTPSSPGTPTAVTVAPGTYTIQVVATDGTTTQKQPITLVVNGN